MSKLKILIADDHAIFRDGIKAIINDFDEFETVAEAESGEQVLEILSQHPVDIILMDIKMKGMNGIEATEKVRQDYPDVKVLALSMHSEESYIVNMLKAGAMGYILKNTGKQELFDAIQSLINNESYFAQEVSSKLLSQFMVSKKEKKEVQPLSALSTREKEVLKLIAEEMTNQQIADQLNISKRTVDTHRKNLLVKLGVKNTVGLIKYALKAGIIE